MRAQFRWLEIKASDGVPNKNPISWCLNTHSDSQQYIACVYYSRLKIVWVRDSIINYFI